MKLHVLLSTALLAVGLVSCDSTIQYQRNNTAAHVWLNTHTAPAAASFNGTWNSDDWGDAFLSQSGRDLTGFFGKYRVEGVVSGQTCYLLLSDGGWYDYSMALSKLNESILHGYYSRSVPYNLRDERPVMMRRAHLR